jgi:hypothetical protein
LNVINIDQDIEEFKNGLSLTMIDNFANNVMPPQFVPDRALVVALAQLLMTTLQQNQAMAETLRQQGASNPH